MINKKMIAAVVVAVLVALVGVGGFVLGRGGDTGQAGEPQPPSTADPAPSETVSVSGTGILERGPIAAGEGGVPDGPSGLRIHYQQTPEGAVQAAVNYDAMLSSDAIYDPAQASALVDAMTIDDAQLRQEYREGLKMMTETFPKGQLKPSSPERGAYAIESVSADKTSVDLLIWGPVDDAEQTVWSVSRYSMVWSDGDWKTRAGVPAATSDGYRQPSPRPNAAEKYDILKNPPTAGPEGEIVGAYKLGWMEFANAPQ